jgi:hypothetical protein
MKRYISLLLFVLIAFSACEKPSLFDAKLPTGRISGTLVFKNSNQPATDVYILLTDNDANWSDITYSRPVTGSFFITRMQAANYTLKLLNDSLITSSTVTFDLKDGEDLNLGNIQIELAPMPVFTGMTVLTTAANAVRIRVNVNDGGNAVFDRGVRIMPASQAGDPATAGTNRQYSYADTWDYAFWEQNLTGLLPNTTYKLKAWVTIKRGLNAQGASITHTIFSQQEYTFTTAAAK